MLRLYVEFPWGLKTQFFSWGECSYNGLVNFVLPSHNVGRDPNLRKPVCCVHSRDGKYVYGTLDKERVFNKIPQGTNQHTKKFMVYLCLKFFHLDILKKNSAWSFMDNWPDYREVICFRHTLLCTFIKFHHARIFTKIKMLSLVDHRNDHCFVAGSAVRKLLNN